MHISSTYPLTSEQIEISNLARDFARREISPVSRLYEIEDISKSDLPNKVCQSGLVNGRIGQQWGGLGLTLFDTALIAQELAFACSGIAALVESSELAITALLICGSAEQQKTYLPMLTEGTGLAGVAMPYSGSGLSINRSLIAVEEGDSIVLNGFCPQIFNADIANWFIVGCSVTESNKPFSHSAQEKASNGYFIVPKNTVGLRFTAGPKLLGRKALCAKRVNFESVRLASIARINISSIGYEKIMAQNAPIIAAGCIGLAQSAFAEAKNYAQQRKTFGVPIANHQAIAFMLASMATDIEAARLLTYQAIRGVDNDAYACKLSKSAQAFALEAASKATIDSVQIFGGYGYTTDYPVEKLMRDARTYQSFYGSTVTFKEQLGQSMLKQIE